MSPLNLAGALIGCAGLLTFLSFSWAVQKHFRHQEHMTWQMKVLSALSLAALAWFGWRVIDGSLAVTWPFAILLFAVALAIFFWAIGTTRRQPPTLAFEDDKPSMLYRNGPYRYVRHPFYLSYITFWIGTAVATLDLLPWLVPLVMLLLYADAARREEQKFANSELARAYAEYREQAGMFLPRASALLPQ